MTGSDEAPRDDVLAPGYPARAVALATLAGRLRRVAGLALQDCGAAVSAAEMALRAEPLLALATACRRADVAAHNAPDDRDGGSAAPPGRLRR